MDENALICPPAFEEEHEITSTTNFAGSFASYHHQCARPGSKRQAFRERRFVVRLSGKLADQRSEHQPDAVPGIVTRRRSHSGTLAARMVERSEEHTSELQ